MIKITEEQFLEHQESNDGFCKNCEEFTRIGDTEPDAENYLCEVCGGNYCSGAEHALISGMIEIK